MYATSAMHPFVFDIETICDCAHKFEEVAAKYLQHGMAACVERAACNNNQV